MTSYNDTGFRSFLHAVYLLPLIIALLSLACGVLPIAALVGALAQDGVLEGGPATFPDHDIGLLYGTIPQALQLLGRPEAWTFVYALSMFCLCALTFLPILDALLTTLCDCFAARLEDLRTVALLALWAGGFLLSFALITKAGLFVYLLIRSHVAAWTTLLQGAIALLALTFAYGMKRATLDLQVVVGWQPSQWLFLAVLGLLVPFLAMIESLYGLSQYSWPVYGEYAFPAWSIAIGWLLVLLPLLAIPALAVTALLYTTAHDKGRTFSQLLVLLPLLAIPALAVAALLCTTTHNKGRTLSQKWRAALVLGKDWGRYRANPLDLPKILVTSTQSSSEPDSPSGPPFPMSPFSMGSDEVFTPSSPTVTIASAVGSSASPMPEDDPAQPSRFRPASRMMPAERKMSPTPPSAIIPIPPSGPRGPGSNGTRARAGPFQGLSLLQRRRFRSHHHPQSPRPSPPPLELDRVADPAVRKPSRIAETKDSLERYRELQQLSIRFAAPAPSSGSSGSSSTLRKQPKQSNSHRSLGTATPSTRGKLSLASNNKVHSSSSSFLTDPPHSKKNTTLSDSPRMPKNETADPRTLDASDLQASHLQASDASHASHASEVRALDASDLHASDASHASHTLHASDLHASDASHASAEVRALDASDLPASQEDLHALRVAYSEADKSGRSQTSSLPSVDNPSGFAYRNPQFDSSQDLNSRKSV